MSPASKSKSKDKRAAFKDPQKPSTKPTSNANTSLPASGYNPLLGTFHTLDSAPLSSTSPIHLNGRPRIFDDTEDHSIGTGVEYDSISNNGSWSGESEDHKEKTSQGSTRQETNLGVDNEKREKIRQKNEKKHQRQKERRAQELHEKCSGYLMSRKLESLAQQLVAMGFSSERATMALILNEGKVEQSVNWLFEGGEDADNQREHNLDGGGGNLKIDISEERAQITEMEIKFKCSKQEVERAIVACEGDLEQAAETLKSQKHEQQPPAAPPKVEETGNGKLSLAMSQNTSTSRTISKSIPVPVQQKTDDRDFNYTKMAVTVGPTSSTELGIKGVQLLKKIPPNSDWTKQQQVATPSVEKRWPVTVGGSNPSVSYSLASPLQAVPPPPQAKTESRYANIGPELKNLQLGSMREPVVMMQRPKSNSMPTNVSLSSSASVGESVMSMNPNGFSHVSSSSRGFNTPSYGPSVNNSQFYDQLYHHQQQQSVPHQQYGPLDHRFGEQGSMNHFNNGGMWNNRMVGPGTSTTPTLAAASSLGLFSGLGSNGSSGPSSPVDWNACDTLQFDYTNIDWSLDRIPVPATNVLRPNGMWAGFGSSTSSADLYGSGMGGGGKTATRPPMGIVSNGNSGHGLGVHHHDMGSEGSSVAAAGGSREWTSPFEEKELFTFPRQFVSSPSL